MSEYVYRLSKKVKHLNFFKNDAVFEVSLLLAVLSSFIYMPKISYIDFKVIITLFSLMVVVKAFEGLKLFDSLAFFMLKSLKNTRIVSAVLILLCFFSSMVITNDVSLLTFVPLTLIIGKKADISLYKTIIFQTIAANLGSSLTPMGNPQNLFIFTHYNLSASQFLSSLMLLAVSGLAILILLTLTIKSRSIEVELSKVEVKDTKKIFVWSAVFLIIILSILKVIDYRISFALTVMTALIIDKKLILKVDYTLLMTFICFFIFVGNISNIKVLSSFISLHLKTPFELYTNSIALCQIISNVPASIFLSKFTSNWKVLLLGVDIGGLGTLVASLASLISYKLFSKEYPKDSSKYILKFSIYNFLILFILMILNWQIV